ncbi:hypothetical protein BGLA2_1670021 [Burkholderia gladioli]|nr:hypothetical protein BGLA2_1670021 [Burkholderia gladioli]
MHPEERAESRQRGALRGHGRVAGPAGQPAKVHRLRPGQPGRLRRQQDLGTARGGIAELAGERGQAGADVGDVVGLAGRHRREGTLAQVHAAVKRAGAARARYAPYRVFLGSPIFRWCRAAFLTRPSSCMTI